MPDFEERVVQSAKGREGVGDATVRRATRLFREVFEKAYPNKVPDVIDVAERLQEAVWSGPELEASDTSRTLGAPTPTTEWLSRRLEELVEDCVAAARERLFGRAETPYKPGGYAEAIQHLKEIAAEPSGQRRPEVADRVEELLNSVHEAIDALENLTGRTWNIYPSRPHLDFRDPETDRVASLWYHPDNGTLAEVKGLVNLASARTGLEEPDLVAHIVAQKPLEIVRARVTVAAHPRVGPDAPSLLRRRVTIEIRTPDITQAELARLHRSALSALWKEAEPGAGERVLPPGLPTKEDIRVLDLVADHGGEPGWGGKGTFWDKLASNHWNEAITGEGLRKKYKRAREKVKGLER